MSKEFSSKFHKVYYFYNRCIVVTDFALTERNKGKQNEKDLVFTLYNYTR